MSKVQVHSFEVRHPELGTVVVTAADRDEATVFACQEWGATWRREYAKLTVRDLGRPITYPCRRCGKQVDKPGYCYDCQKAVEQFRRDMARARGPRHTGYRGRR